MSALAVLLLTSPIAATPEICRTVHGRLVASNGTPSLRIIDTRARRVLGISGSEDAPDIPGSIVSRLRDSSGSLFYRELIGNFEVCTNRRQRPGEMQMIRVISVRDAHIRRQIDSEVRLSALQSSRRTPETAGRTGHARDINP